MDSYHQVKSMSSTSFFFINIFPNFKAWSVYPHTMTIWKIIRKYIKSCKHEYEQNNGKSHSKCEKHNKNYNNCYENYTFLTTSFSM